MWNHFKFVANCTTICFNILQHPTHGYSAYGKYTPPAPNIYTIGAYDEGPHSIQLPYAMMKWW